MAEELSDASLKTVPRMLLQVDLVKHQEQRPADHYCVGFFFFSN